MKLSELLTKQANELLNSSAEVVAVGLLKQAGLTEDEARTEVAQKLMEKEATARLTESGIDYDQALQLVKAAGIKVKDLASFKPEPTFEEVIASQFMKAASLAEQMEALLEQNEGLVEKVAELEGVIEHTPQVREVPDHITKLAQSGSFTNEDLEALMSLPSETLTKVASVQEQPWKMGKSAGASSEGAQDPLLAFILS